MDSTLLLLTLSTAGHRTREDASIPPSLSFIRATVCSLEMTRQPASTGPQLWQESLFAVSFEFCDGEGILMVLEALLRPELSSEWSPLRAGSCPS